MSQTGKPVKIKKLLVANRGEIAVRILRAAKDQNIETVAIYAEPDSDAIFVNYADEAYALGGNSPATTYLDAEKIISIAKKSGANAIHPGYGFLSENAEFAKKVIQADLIWIGPPPHAIEALGDKVTARDIAAQVGAPLVRGTKEPVFDSKAAENFAKDFGLPIAIKAAFGGGGRGMKVAWKMEDVAELFESATREATVAFGRGECFIERYLDKPRHVEAQVLADKFGNVIVVGTRDCSLQRRFQKLVEEAPAPFLTKQQTEQIVTSAKNICKKINYESAGTVEYLVGSDGTVSFLEVNTRIQVEHPVTEEVTGIDLIAEQFKIAEGKPLTFTEDPKPRGHAIEFRINGEDPARKFLPTPGVIKKLIIPQGPGVRFDSGIKTGDIISGQFDSMLAKLIISGADRNQAIARAKRALAELEISGISTVIPFDKAILNDPAFIGTETGFNIYTRWIEEEWNNTLTAENNVLTETTPVFDFTKTDIPVEVDGKRVVVSIPKQLLHGNTKLNHYTGEPQIYYHEPKNRIKTLAGVGSHNDKIVVSPMQGTIVKLAVKIGDTVTAGQLLAVVEAMKMENPITATIAGTVAEIKITTGETVSPGTVLFKIDD